MEVKMKMMNKTNDTASLVDNSLNLDDVEMFASEILGTYRQTYTYPNGSIITITTTEFNNHYMCAGGGTTDCTFGATNSERSTSIYTNECSKSTNGGYDCNGYYLMW